MYKYIKKAWDNPRKNMKELYQERMVLWRRQPVTIRIARPTRLDRARSLGYKPKLGVILVRQKVKRGSHLRPQWAGGRRPKNTRITKVLNQNYQQIAEQRASKKYVNAEVLNSYFVGKDGHHVWYEVILLDRAHPSIKADKNYAKAAARKGRAERGLNRAARKAKLK